MNHYDYHKLANIPALGTRPIQGHELENQTPRTLMFGYTLDNYTFHVYLDESGTIQKVVYAGTSLPMLILHDIESNISTDHAYAPNKRIYPEASDFEFCEMLKKRGVELLFTTFNPERDQSQAFHGKRLRELHQPGGSVHMVNNR